MKDWKEYAPGQGPSYNPLNLKQGQIYSEFKVVIRLFVIQFVIIQLRFIRLFVINIRTAHSKSPEIGLLRNIHSPFTGAETVAA